MQFQQVERIFGKYIDLFCRILYNISVKNQLIFTQISLNGFNMDYERTLAFLKEKGQEHLLQYYGELNEREREQLLEDISKIDFSAVAKVCKSEKKPGELAPADAVTLEEIEKRRGEFEKAGVAALKNGKVAAVLLAGGQGSRLGFSGPKGMFDIGVTRKLSIFEQQFNNIAEVVAKTGTHFHIFVMTSRSNNDATVEFFKESGYFGYPAEYVHFYIQDVAPACDYDGKIFLDEKHRVSLAPNGNGGWYSSLVKSGLGGIIERENIEWLNVYSVDNVLQRICDPLFIGATLIKGCACGAKVVKKVCADEKVGVLCKEDGKPAIVEYYEMPQALKAELTDGGELKYRYGVTLNYLFKIKDLNGTLSGKLPPHYAEKAIAHVENGVRVVPDKPCGYKTETLVVDMIKMMDSCLACEVDREREFAPVKNATGADSVETARELLVKNGVEL